MTNKQAFCLYVALVYIGTVIWIAGAYLNEKLAIIANAIAASQPASQEKEKP